jgi:hypothetical protein
LKAIRSRHWLIAAALSLAAIGIIVGVERVRGFPNAVNTTHSSGATIHLRVTMDATQPDNACVRVMWETDGIGALYLDGGGRGGSGEEIHCEDAANYTPQFTVEYSDGSSMDYTLARPPVIPNGTIALLAALTGFFLLAGVSRLSPHLNDTAWGVTLFLLLVIFYDYANHFLAPSVRLSFHAAVVLIAPLCMTSDRVNTRWLLGVLWLTPIVMLFTAYLGMLSSDIEHLTTAGVAIAVVLYGVTLGGFFWTWGTPSAKVRERLGNMGAATFGVVVTLVLLEVGVRIVFPVSDIEANKPLHIGVPRAEDGSPAMQPNAEWYQTYPSDPRGAFEDGNRVYYQTNNVGFRDDDFTTERTPNVPRVALIGDSFAMGLGVRRADNVASVMERVFAEQFNCDVEVYNFAVSGHNTPEYVAQVRDIVPPYQPDVVLVWYFLNDIGLTKSQFFDEALQAENPVFPFARRISRVADLTSQRLQRYRRAEQGIQNIYEHYNSPLWERVAADLAAIADEAAALDVPYGLFTHPILFRLDSYPYAELHQRVLAAAEADGYFTADLTPTLAGNPYATLWVHPIDSHPNETAHAITGEYAALMLTPYLPDCQPDSAD